MRRKLGAGPRVAGAWRLACGAIGAAAAHEIFDAAVFERMERDDGKPSARLEQPLGRREAAIEFVELIVHGDAQRLEGTGRGIDAAGSGTTLRIAAASSLVRVSGARRRWPARCGARSALRRNRG